MAKKPAKKKAAAIKAAPEAPAKAAPKRVAKKPPARRYNAAGLSKAGVMLAIRDRERMCMGRRGYPWDDKVVSQMVDACDGKRTASDVAGAIESLVP